VANTQHCHTGLSLCLSLSICLSSSPAPASFRNNSLSLSLASLGHDLALIQMELCDAFMCGVRGAFQLDHGEMMASFLVSHVSHVSFTCGVRDSSRMEFVAHFD